MSKYYLVAKSKNSEDFEIIKFRENEIYSNGNDVLERCFNLEKIDLFTSRFHTEEKLIQYLKENGRIKTDDVDLFVVSRNGNKIKFLNCIYYFGNRVELLRNIMIDSDKSKLNEDSKFASSLLDDFITNIYERDKYYTLVTYGYTDIYKKFVDYFRGRNVDLKTLLAAKYRDGKWALTSYNLHRNIIDSYQLFNKFYREHDMFTAISDHNRKTRINRESIINGIRQLTDKDYVEGQMSMFDMMDVSTNSEVKQAEEKQVSSTVSEQRTKQAEQFVQTKILTHDDKLVEVMTFLNKFPRGMFVGDNLEFNTRIFPGCDVSELNKISVRLKRLINSYTVIKYHYDRAVEYRGNTRELAIDLNQDKKTILKLLEKDTILDKFYDFCMLYDKIKTEYESKVMDGKVYGKREDN